MAMVISSYMDVEGGVVWVEMHLLISVLKVSIVETPTCDI